MPGQGVAEVRREHEVHRLRRCVALADLFRQWERKLRKIWDLGGSTYYAVVQLYKWMCEHQRMRCVGMISWVYAQRSRDDPKFALMK
mmetsp:Transcript_6359/g.10625  ORF Transcript_6359/g.10625 Transcript_6359/m.10625 type:complete len:87 (-) Transcript_6359:294-554(-)